MGNKRQSGAVSIFSVVFSALLLTVLTVGFIGLMISGQQRAINNDLSQSAYDASLAGVEDAKRVVRACLGGSSQACQALEASDDCSVISRAGVVGGVGDEETTIRSVSSSGEQFDQAYTCVNINMNTPDYRDEVREGSSRIVPLRAAGDFNQVIIEWYTQDDAGEATPAARPTPPSVPIESLPSPGAWSAAAPPLVRAQLITPGASYSLTSLDDSAASQTVFLRPSTVAAGSTELIVPVSGLARATNQDEATNQPTPVSCSRNFANNAHSCRVILELDATVSRADSVNALLRLNTIYKTANVRVSLALDGSSVMFYGVQPLVDSTGRANDLFRRVEARLMVGDDFPYPSYGVDVENDLCKNFSVSDSGVVNPSACTP